MKLFLQYTYSSSCVQLFAKIKLDAVVPLDFQAISLFTKAKRILSWTKSLIIIYLFNFTSYMIFNTRIPYVLYFHQKKICMYFILSDKVVKGKV